MEVFWDQEDQNYTSNKRQEFTREERLNRINTCLEANPVNQDHCFDLI